MTRVTLELPALLRDLVGRDELDVDAATPAEALSAAADALPALRTHLFDSSGAVRRHVLCFRNEQALRRDALDAPLAPGDRLRVHQAVSGG